MKKILLNLTTLLGLLVISCSDNNEDYSMEFTDEKSLKTTYDLIISLDDTDLQKQTLYSLSSHEIAGIWQIKLNDFLLNNDLDENQINFINSLKSDLNYKIFVKNSTERMAFLRTEKDNYMSQAIKLFGKNEALYLLTKVENINQRLFKLSNKNEVNKYQKEVPIKACNCEQTNNDCYRLTGISVWGLSWEYGDCASKTCYQREYLGIWVSENNGMCQY